MFIISAYIIFIDVRGIAVVVRTGKTNIVQNGEDLEANNIKENKPGIRERVNSVCESYKKPMVISSLNEGKVILY